MFDNGTARNQVKLGSVKLAYNIDIQLGWVTRRTQEQVILLEPLATLSRDRQVPEQQLAI